MSTAMEQDVAKKKAKPAPTPEPEDRDRKPVAIQIRGEAVWKAWVERLAEYDERPVAMVIERSLREYAEKIGFEESPPKR